MAERGHTPDEIRSNCANEKECHCAAVAYPYYWQCENWGRSSLTMPRVLKHGRSTTVTEFRDDGQRRITKSLKVAKERGLPVPDQFKDANKYLKRKLT